METGVRLTRVLQSIAWINSTSSGGIVTVIILPATTLGEWIEKCGTVEVTRSINTSCLIITGGKTGNIVKIKFDFDVDLNVFWKILRY